MTNRKVNELMELGKLRRFLVAFLANEVTKGPLMLFVNRLEVLCSDEITCSYQGAARYS